MKTVESMKEIYQKNIAVLQKELGMSGVMEVPRITKVVVNVGIGRITKESESVAEVVNGIEAITGQRPIKTTARKSLAGFKIREGQDIGVKVTLRGARMWDFLTRLVGMALPRVRDFQGIAVSTVDQNGNLNIGIKEHTVFPEIVVENVRHLFGLQVTVVSTTQSHDEAETLFRTLGFPLKKEAN